MSGFGISNLPIYHEQIHSSEPQVENNYQRKADLIPNLLATAKGFSAPCKDWQVKGPFGRVFKIGISQTATKQKSPQSGPKRLVEGTKLFAH